MGKHSYKHKKSPRGSTIREKLDFHSIPVTESGCWIWIGSLRKNGYGQLNVDGKMVGAHRVSYQEYRGPISGDLFVCHICDVKACINPYHLFLGTNSDNIRDMYSKGSGPITKWKGEGHPRSKITEIQAIEIKNSNISSRKIAKQYGISSSTVRGIRTGRYWKHLTELE